MRSIGYKSRLVSAPGATNSGDMVAVSMPEGHARGIVIDNPSGSWLSVSSLYDLVPPYTLQWSRDLPVGAASVTVRYVAGPAEQVSTQDGDPFTIWLDTDPVGASNGIVSPGSAFITGFTPVQFAFTNPGVILPLSIPNTTILSIVPATTERLRILLIRLQYDLRNTNYNNVSPVEATMSTPGVITYGTLAIDAEKSIDELIVPGGLDLGLGNKFVIAGGPTWADEYVKTFVAYQIL